MHFVAQLSIYTHEYIFTPTPVKKKLKFKKEYEYRNGIASETQGGFYLT